MIEKLPLRLDLDVPSEKKIYDAYCALPRSRRQEWLRSILKAGMAVQSAAEANVMPPTNAMQPLAHAVVAHSRNAGEMPRPSSPIREETPTASAERVSARDALSGFFANGSPS